MRDIPGRVGKKYPAFNHASGSGPTAQASIVGDRFGWIVALLAAIIAIVLAVIVLVTVMSLRSDLENIRGLIDSSASAASQAAVAAAVAAERADKAERAAAINREYAAQVFPQLNRLGYPVKTPGEVDHYVAQPEDYERLEVFRRQRDQHTEVQK